MINHLNLVKTQLEGLKLFFKQQPVKENESAANCISCHPAPQFTDFSLHNIGVTQAEYELIHGQGSFNKLFIPNYEERSKKSDIYLPATVKNPQRAEIFRRPASKENSNFVDLGAWNIFFNEDYPQPQKKLMNIICDQKELCLTSNDALQRSIARFKTPSLRDLGHSAPYMHNGQISDLHAVVGFYIATAHKNQNGLIRNGDKELDKIIINTGDIQPLVKFLISLYEDYH